MTTRTDRIRQMAQEAGFSVDENGAINDGVETAADFSDELTRFAQLVAEDCAKLVETDLYFEDAPGHVRSALFALASALRTRYGLED